MFDLGFWEMLMIVLVALVVVGPERLPGLARTAGFWVGKAKRMISDVKSEIDQELASEELKKVLDKQNLMEDVYEIIEETKEAGKEVQREVEGLEQQTTSADDKTPKADSDAQKS